MMDATGKKPFKQKGTGRARAGSSVSPLWVGGAVVHGPTPRKYGYKLPKSVRRAALLSVLTKKREDGQLTVVDGLSSSEGKTKEMIAVLNNMGLSGKSVLVVAGTKESSEDFLKLSRALRNVSGASLVKVAGLNVYDILKHTHLLIAKEALELLENRLKEE
jgi:large subunit ribosomal protein L4